MRLESVVRTWRVMRTVVWLWGAHQSIGGVAVPWTVGGMLGTGGLMGRGERGVKWGLVRGVVMERGLKYVPARWLGAFLQKRGRDGERSVMREGGVGEGAERTGRRWGVRARRVERR